MFYLLLWYFFNNGLWIYKLELTSDQLNAVAMTSVYNKEENNNQRGHRCCKACPGEMEDDWLDSNAFYNVCEDHFSV
jgi:hypothetical protein